MLSHFEVANTFLPEGFATWNAVQQMDNGLRVGVKGMDALQGRGEKGGGRDSLLQGERAL